MSALTDAQLDALRTLQRAYPARRIALIGAAALGLRLDMKWRHSADLDLAIAIGWRSLPAICLAGKGRGRSNTGG